MVIDPTTSIGKIRLRTGDWTDLPTLPDSVIQSALDDSDQDIPKATILCAQYILATLVSKVHRKMGLSLEVFGQEYFENYLAFIKATILNPNFASLAPIPYSSCETDGNVIADFISDWNRNYYNGTESQALAASAERSPNLGGRYGFGGLD